MKTAAVLVGALAGASAFQVATPLKGAVRSSSTMQMAARSKSIPFAPQPAALDGTIPGDVGFDPLGLTSIDFDWAKWIVPTRASMRKGDEPVIVDTLYWMREAEIKHCRVAMLAVVGWLAVDMGLRLPGSKYVGLSAISAHDAMVAGGNMVVLFHFALLLELINGAAIFAAAQGSGREPGNFALDPLGLSKDSAKSARYQLSEIKNGRLAMLAFGGIATQAVLTGHGFPYLF